MSRGVQRFPTMAAFGRHRTGGGNRKFLKWKDRGWIETWMHTKTLPMAIFRHQIPTIVIKEDKQDKSKKPEKHVWSKQLVCHETVEVLEAQHWRDKETGERKHPPERCGICKLVEWCYQQAVLFEETRGDKKPKGLNFTTPIFHFESDEPDETTTLHVGGLCNLFGKDGLSDEQKEDMKEAKISPKHAWKENTFAKCNYAMVIVNNAEPDAGVQIAVEASLLGDKIKKVLEDMLEANDRDIQQDPYCIKWKYLEKEQEFSKKYDALVMPKIRITPKIKELITGEVPELPPDLTEPFNQQSVRMMLERHCVLPKGAVPWDELFPSKEQSEAWAKEDAAEAKKQAELDSAADEREEEDEQDEDDEDEDDDEGGDEEEDDEGDDDKEEMFACDNDECGKPVRATDKSCPHCGMKFNVTDEEEKPKEPEPPKMRTRAEAMADKKKSANGSAKKTKKKDADEEEGGVDEDGIPF